MRPTFALGLALGWRRVVAVFAAVVAVLWTGSLFHGRAALPVAATVAVLVAAVAVLTWRGATLLSLIGRRRGGAVTTAVAPAHEHELQWAQTSAAIRSAGHDLIAVVAVDGPSHIPSVLDHHRVQSAATLPVAVIADALRQFDVALSGIDILSVGRRRASKAHHHYAATYSAIVGDHPAMGRRRTWCVLRMNSLDNLAAVACRESVAATLAACAQRLAVELSARRCAARVVDAAELADVDELLSSGVGGPGAKVRPHWGGVSHERGFATSYWVSPRDISTATLDRLWVPDTEYTATAIQLRPTPDGAASVGVLVHYGTGGPLREAPLTGLNPLSGRHDLALRAGLADAPVPPIRAPHRMLQPDEDLRAPIGASGVILGATTAGHPLLVDLGAAAPSATATITVAGELALLVQLALRAAATGYQVLVVSARSERWRQASAAGLRVLPELPEQLPDNGRAVMVVYDQTNTGGATAAITMRAVAPGSASVADVHVEQDSPRTAVIRTADFQYRANIDVSAERNLIGTPPEGRAA